MPATNLDSMSVGLYIIGSIIAASVSLGSVIYFNNRKSKTALVFYLLTLVSSVWSILNFLSYNVSDPTITLWIIRFVMFTALYQALFFFLLMLFFPSTDKPLPKTVTRIIIPIAILVSFWTLSPFVFSSINISSIGTPEPKTEPGMLFFVIVAIPLVISGLIMMINKFRKADSNNKPQFIYVLTGFIMMFLLIILFNFVLPLIFKISFFIPLGAIFIFPFIATTFYAILRHQLLNIRIVGTEILAFLLIIVTFLEVILSRSIEEVILRVAVFAALTFVSMLLIRSVVNEQKQRERLEELTNKLQLMDKQKNEFISVAAHELRGPLTAIKGYLSLVFEGDGGKVPQGALDYLNDAFNSANRMVRLISNLLNVGRIEEGRIVYQMGYLNLKDVATTVFKEYATEAKSKSLDFEYDPPKTVKDYVYVDKDRIHEVIGNFISNAIKYTEKGKVTLKLSNPRPEVVRVEVTDTGPGIKENEQQQLFQKFYRVASVASAVSGTGLGLYVSRLLVEQFNGKIGCNSKEGQGSTFWFELPVALNNGEDKASSVTINNIAPTNNLVKV